MGNYRVPDLSVENLNRNGGQGFLQLLRHVVQSGIDFPDGSDWYPVVSPIFDKAFAISREKEYSAVPRSVRAMQTGTQTSKPFHHVNSHLLSS